VCYSRDASESVSEYGWDEIAADGTVVDRTSLLLDNSPASDCMDETSAIYLPDLSEGAPTYRVWVKGTVSGFVYSDPWTVYIDRTPPDAP
jgi:hypothetical protein